MQDDITDGVQWLIEQKILEWISTNCPSGILNPDNSGCVNIISRIGEPPSNLLARPAVPLHVVRRVPDGRASGVGSHFVCRRDDTRREMVLALVAQDRAGR